MKSVTELFPRPPAADPVAQTTERLNALNATLVLLGDAAKDPTQQSKEERAARRKLRADVYAEIARLIGPEERVELIPSIHGGTTPPGSTDTRGKVVPAAPVIDHRGHGDPAEMAALEQSGGGSGGDR